MGPHESLPRAFSMRRKKPTQMRVLAVNSVPPPNSGIKCTEVITQLRKPAQGIASREEQGGDIPQQAAESLEWGGWGPLTPSSPLPLTGRTMACQRRNILHILSLLF